jgi:hypothetical protein
MAEFLEKKVEPVHDGFNAMGKPIPINRRRNAYKTCREIGINHGEAWHCVNGMAEQLERDEPYHAIEIGMQYVDLTGCYRLLAVLLVS